MARFRIQETFAEVAAERGVEIVFNSKVTSIDKSNSAVILKDGTRMEADLIVGADGKYSSLKSFHSGVCHQKLTLGNT